MQYTRIVSLLAILCGSGRINMAAAMGFRGTGGAPLQPQAISFTEVLSKALRTDAFKKQVESTVPSMCDGSDDVDACRLTITKALACTSFIEKAKSFPKDMEGIGAFIQRCDHIERAVPNLSSVIHWVQTPDELFNQAVTNAEAKTGVTLGNPLAQLEALGGDGGDAEV